MKDTTKQQQGDGGVLPGTLIGVSSDTVNPSAEGLGGALVWSFDNLELDKETLYSAVFVDSTGAFVNFATELDTTNSYSGGRTLGFTGVNAATWDSEFTAVYTAVPEPSAFLMGAVCLMGFLGLRKRKRQG